MFGAATRALCSRGKMHLTGLVKHEVCGSRRNVDQDGNMTARGLPVKKSRLFLNGGCIFGSGTQRDYKSHSLTVRKHLFTRLLGALIHARSTSNILADHDHPLRIDPVRRSHAVGRGGKTSAHGGGAERLQQYPAEEGITSDPQIYEPSLPASGVSKLGRT